MTRPNLRQQAEAVALASANLRGHIDNLERLVGRGERPEQDRLATRATRRQDRLARQAMVGAGQLNQQPNAKVGVDARRPCHGQRTLPFP